MELIDNSLIQMGAIGITLLGLIYFSRYMFVYLMKQMKQQSDENKALEKAFRDYLLNNSKEHHMIIERNTEVNERLVELISTQMALLQHHGSNKN